MNSLPILGPFWVVLQRSHSPPASISLAPFAAVATAPRCDAPRTAAAAAAVTPVTGTVTGTVRMPAMENVNHVRVQYAPNGNGENEFLRASHFFGVHSI